MEDKKRIINLTETTTPGDNTYIMTDDSSAGAKKYKLKALHDLIAKIGSTVMGTTATTVTGAIAEHESDISGIKTSVGSVNISNVGSSVTGAIGNTTLGTTATTLSGAIAEHESDISTLNSNINPLAITKGGTGATNFGDARRNLGLTRATLGSGDDLNTLTGWDSAGLYQISTSVANSPASWCWLLVIGGAGTIQVVFESSRINMRAYTGSPLAWGSWRKVDLT